MTALLPSPAKGQSKAKALRCMVDKIKMPWYEVMQPKAFYSPHPCHSDFTDALRQKAHADDEFDVTSQPDS